MSNAQRGWNIGRAIVDWILGIAIAGLFFGGVEILFFPNTLHPDSFARRHRLIEGTLFLAIAIPTLIATMRRWVRALPGLLAAATLMAFSSMLSGHAPNLPAVPMSHKSGIAFTMLFAGSTVLSGLAFKNRDLKLADRILLMVFLFALSWGISDDSAAFASLSIAFSCLLLSWLYSRFLHRSPE
jgi:hypothetical protein